MIRLLNYLAEPEVLGFLGLIGCVLGAWALCWAIAGKICSNNNRRLRLDWIGIHIKPKPKSKHMRDITINYDNYLELRFVPRDLNGKLVNLDAGAMKVNPIAIGDGATARILSEAVEQIEGQDVRVFTAAFITPSTRGDYPFAIEGDPVPGEEESMLREELMVKARPPQAVTFGLEAALTTFTQKPKSELPPAPPAPANNPA